MESDKRIFREKPPSFHLKQFLMRDYRQVKNLSDLLIHIQGVGNYLQTFTNTYSTVFKKDTFFTDSLGYRLSFEMDDTKITFLLNQPDGNQQGKELEDMKPREDIELTLPIQDIPFTEVTPDNIPHIQDLMKIERWWPDGSSSLFYPLHNPYEFSQNRIYMLLLQMAVAQTLLAVEDQTIPDL